MIKTGIIIPFFGGSDYLPRLLSSIFSDNEGFDIQVFIIDNSKPSERLIKHTLTDKRIVLIEAPAGIGYGKACNIGFARCVAEGKDVLIVVNQDGYFSNGTMKVLINTLNNQIDFTVAMPLLTEYETTNVERFFTHVYLTPMPELVSDLFRNEVKEFYPMQNLCGACFALKLKGYQCFSYLFDDLYEMYFEDEDLFIRLNRMNLQVMFVPGAIFHHSHSNTTNYHTQSIYSKSIHRTSKHIFTFKKSGKSIGRALPGWLLLELRTVFELVLKLNFRDLAVEIISIFKVLRKMPAIRKRRKSENDLIQRACKH